MVKFSSRFVLLTLLAFFALPSVQPAHAQVMVGVQVSFGPPPLPIYDQPPCPEDGYIWTPGYWAYDDDDGYYWVPGTWVPAPETGYLWTPGWWGWGDGGYFAWHEGYWGPHVGYYGGINYGFGYTGDGFYGGRWDHDHFYYNTAVVRVNEVSIHNVYRDTTVIRNTTVINHVSYNGGQGGISARPTREQESYSQERHMAPVAVQTQHMQMARGNPQLRASVNQGRPQIAATARANEFNGQGAVAARQAGGEYHAPSPQQRGAQPGRGNNEVRPTAPGGQNGARPSYEARPVTPNGGNEPRPENGARPAEPPSHARDLQPHQMEQSPNAGSSREEQKYQQQQQKLIEKQNQEHQKLQQQQEKEDRQAQQRNFNQQRQQQVEQKHQQQTQQMEQRHQQQTERAQPRQSPPPHENSQPRDKHPQ